MITNWKNKKVAVLGLGVEGISSVKFLIKRGAKVTVLDRKDKKELVTLLRHSGERQRLQNLSARLMVKGDSGQARMTDAKIVGGDNYLKNLNGFDVIVRSPGVKRNLPEILDAEENGAIITSQTKIFFDLCPSPIIGATGTKGKGTTATLIYEMLKNQGFDAYLGGNIGKPPFEFLDKLNKQSWVVLELSSFQLQDLTKSPHIAVVLMITSEHLDYHKDVYEYVSAKRNILRFQKNSDFAIVNKDYPVSRESDILTQGKVFEVSREGEVKEGCFVKEGTVKLKIINSPYITSFWERRAKPEFACERSETGVGRLQNLLATGRNGRDSGHGQNDDKCITSVINIKDILLSGKHNLENVCAAVMAVSIAGVSKENIVKVLRTFKGLEHRLELVGEINGVKYYDDSFSTIPETAIAGIEAFSQPEILILGGSSKGSDFTELGRVISNSKNIKAIIGIGVEWTRVKLKIKNEKLKIIEGCKDMEEIAQAAFDAARSGDVVLLSPACASFDMFKNYKDRGEQFKKEVSKLKP